MDERFEDTIRHLTRSINGQYPRPWMTKLEDPCRANVFVVGKNQAKGYSTKLIGDQDKHVDALFNRNGQSCRGLYDELTGGKLSVTRRNTDSLVDKLASVNVRAVLETNIVCYSTPMSNALSSSAHKGGWERGEDIFRFLLREIRPQVLIVHGESASKELGKLLSSQLPSLPRSPESIVKRLIHVADWSLCVYPIPSLAPPAFYMWISWSAAYLEKLASDIAAQLERTS
jgi:hypothetical protein